MASNRRIRGDCGSVGTPIERDPQNQADFPTTPMLPLIETPDTDALFTWARNMTMSLEDWFNLLSQAVYDGDDQLTDLYECYCIRLCATGGPVPGTPCKTQDCTAFDTTLLAMNPLCYFDFYDILDVTHGGTLVTADLSGNGRVGGMGGDQECRLDPEAPYGCSGEQWSQIFDGVDSLLGITRDSTVDPEFYAAANDQTFISVISLGSISTEYRGGTYAGNVPPAADGTGGIVDYRIGRQIFDGRQHVIFMAYGISPLTGINESVHTGWIDVHDTDIFNDDNTSNYFLLGFGYQQLMSETFDTFRINVNGIQISNAQVTNGIRRAGQYGNEQGNFAFSWGKSRKAQASVGFDLARGAIISGQVEEADMAALYDAYTRTFPDYVDPDPTCVTLCNEYACDAIETALLAMPNIVAAYPMYVGLSPEWTGTLQTNLVDPATNAMIAGGAGGAAFDNITPCSPTECYVSYADAYNSGSIMKAYTDLGNTLRHNWTFGGLFRMNDVVPNSANILPMMAVAGGGSWEETYVSMQVTTGNVYIVYFNTDITNWSTISFPAAVTPYSAGGLGKWFDFKAHFSAGIGVVSGWIEVDGVRTSKTQSGSTYPATGNLPYLNLFGRASEGNTSIGLDSLYTFFYDGEMTAEETALYSAAVAQNAVGYVDPNPACIAPCRTYECDALYNQLLLSVEHLWTHFQATATTSSPENHIPDEITGADDWKLYQFSGTLGVDPLIETCVGETASGISSSAGWGIGVETLGIPGVAGIDRDKGTFGGLYERTNAFNGTIAGVAFQNGGGGSSVYLKVSNNDIEISMEGGADTGSEVYTNAWASGANFYHVDFAWTGAAYTCTLYRNFVSLGERTGTLTGRTTPNTADVRYGLTDGAFGANTQLSIYSVDPISADNLTALQEAWEQNKSTYVDPDPNCGLTIGVAVAPTPVDSDILVYNEACGGWTFEQRPRGTQVYFQINEPVEAVEGDFWSTTVSLA